MADGMSTSPFDTIPPELRNNIWESVFEGLWDDITIRLWRNPWQSKERRAHPRLSLLLTCKRIKQEAQGFAWRDVAAVVGNRDEPKLEPKIERSWLINDGGDMLDDTYIKMIAESQFERMQTQIGSRLLEVTDLECQDECGLQITKATPRYRTDKVQSITVALLMAKLTNVRRVRVVSGSLYVAHSRAVVKGSMSLAKQREIIQGQSEAREQLSKFHALYPAIEEFEVRPPIWSTWEDTGPIAWQLSGRRFTHINSGTVLEALEV